MFAQSVTFGQDKIKSVPKLGLNLFWHDEERKREKERKRGKKLLMFGRMLHPRGMITHTHVCFLSDAQDWRIQICLGLSPPGSTGFTDSRLNWDQPFARITTCVMSRLISVQAKRGCENEEQVAAPPLCRSCI